VKPASEPVHKSEPVTEPQSDFGFRKVPSREKVTLVGQVFSSVAQRYDLMNDLMSLGIHRLWKRHFMAIAGLRPGDQVLDLAGGSGDISLLAADAVGARGLIVLSDINRDMLRVGRDRVLDANCSERVVCAQINAEQLPFAARSFDLITIAFGLRNVTDKLAALKEMRRVCKIGGKAMVLEFSELRIEALKPLYDLYSFQVLPRLGKAIANDAESYRYLAESIRKHPNQQALKQLMVEAGFERVEVHNLSAGLVAIHCGWVL